jgi:Ca-activated chloride channel family protein
VDFDPKVVVRYRLVGYENRAVADRDFRNDEVDGGELGAGHSVTALYELELAPGVGSLGTVFVRGQLPDTRRPFEVNAPIGRNVFAPSLDRASTELRFATAVALAADHLRGNGAQTDWPLGRIVELAVGATRGDADRQELVGLLEKADAAERRGERVAQAARPVNDGY